MLDKLDKLLVIEANLVKVVNPTSFKRELYISL
jgi:hypothetical protein